MSDESHCDFLNNEEEDMILLKKRLEMSNSENTQLKVHIFRLNEELVKLEHKLKKYKTKKGIFVFVKIKIRQNLTKNVLP